MLNKHRDFQPTRWSVVQRAIGSDQESAKTAMGVLCESYWYPVYAYIRRTGYTACDAEELTQGFFAWLIEHETFARADASKGKLRTFLLVCLRGFLGDERDRAMAAKRGARILTSFDAIAADDRYAAEPVDELSPDRLFQRRWALEIISQALVMLEREYTKPHEVELYAALRTFLGFSPEAQRRYEEISAELGRPVATLKNDVFRLRQRWKELIFELLELTLPEGTEADIKAEMKELIGYV